VRVQKLLAPCEGTRRTNDPKARSERCHAAAIARVSTWLNSTGQIDGRRSVHTPQPCRRRPADTPLSNPPLDGFINRVGGWSKPRACGLKNRERTNREPMLTQLHANREYDQNDYVRTIRTAWSQPVSPRFHASRGRRCGRPSVAALTARRAVLHPRAHSGLSSTRRYRYGGIQVSPDERR
jgi:hypothetical protein